VVLDHLKENNGLEKSKLRPLKC